MMFNRSPSAGTVAIRMHLLCILMALVSVLAVSCGRQADVPWQDSHYMIYATDSDFNATKLGYNNNPGILGLVDSEVVAAGSSPECVFVERLVRASGRREFYIVPKESSTNHSGTVEGPFTEAQFSETRTARHLPGFTWRKK